MQRVKVIAIPLVLILSIIGCGLPSFLNPPAPTPEPTLPAPTVIQFTRTPRQDATEIIILPTATPTPPATQTPLPSATPSITATSIPCNWAQFISDISYPDDSQVVADRVFVKTWRFKNIGTCTWNSSYRVVFAEGNGMGLPAEGVSIGANAVGPGALVDVSVSLKAPENTGPYQGFFRFKSPDGTVFGIGQTAFGKFWVKIQSVDPTSTPTITPTEKP